MLIAYWIVAGLAALIALFAGTVKLARTQEQLIAMGQKYNEDLKPWQTKVIGAAEVLGGLGLVVPMLTGILPVLSPIAGIGIAILQAGAFVTHVRRGELKGLPVNVVIFALAGAAAVLGFFVVAAQSLSAATQPTTR